MRKRQVHLDFHTSPDITGIGASFNKNEFTKTLKDAHIDSMTGVIMTEPALIEKTERFLVIFLQKKSLTF